MERKYITVKIKGAVNPKRWYAGKAGETIEVYMYDSPYAYCKETDKQISLEDCEILN